MPFRFARTRMAVLVGALGLLLARQARADADTIIYGTLGCLLPADVGVAIPADDSAPRFVIGWTWQLPLILSTRPSRGLVHHRLVPSVELLPESGGVAWRGRIGYRVDLHHAFAGAGVGVDRSGANLSPELGVKFAHLFDEPTYDIDLSMHMLARAEIAPESGHVRGVTILFGWNIF